MPEAGPSIFDRYTPDICERIFHRALTEGDTKGVEAALLVMARKDPRRAAKLYDELKTALAARRFLDEYGRARADDLNRWADDIERGNDEETTHR